MAYLPLFSGKGKRLLKESLIKAGLSFSEGKIFRFKAKIAEDGSREAIACYLEEPRHRVASILRPERKKAPYRYSLANSVRSLCVFKICNGEAGYFHPKKTIHDLFRGFLNHIHHSFDTFLYPFRNF
jgi:hypothetical protein